MLFWLRMISQRLEITILMVQLQSFQRLFLVVATLLTLVFLPALYVAWFRIRPASSSSGQTPDGLIHQEAGVKTAPLEAVA